jgi:Domain of unknown function (DU1801)
MALFCSSSTNVRAGRLSSRGGPCIFGAAGARELLDARDHHFGYSFNGRYSERIMCLAPMKDYVRLGFIWGGYLPDPERLLIGERKRLRHIKVGSLKDAANRALKSLVKAAWADAKANRKPTLEL